MRESLYSSWRLSKTRQATWSAGVKLRTLQKDHSVSLIGSSCGIVSLQVPVIYAFFCKMSALICKKKKINKYKDLKTYQIGFKVTIIFSPCWFVLSWCSFWISAVGEVFLGLIEPLAHSRLWTYMNLNGFSSSRSSESFCAELKHPVKPKSQNHLWAALTWGQRWPVAAWLSKRGWSSVMANLQCMRFIVSNMGLLIPPWKPIYQGKYTMWRRLHETGGICVFPSAGITSPVRWWGQSKVHTS